MHFLGAVIAEREEDVDEILATWSEYADVPEYVSQTRGEIIADGRDRDHAYLEEYKSDNDPLHKKFKRKAAERLVLDDAAALKAYAEYYGLTLNEDGDAVSTFNKDSFYDYYEIGNWEGTEALQGIDCHELLERHRKGDRTARNAIGMLCVICGQDWRDGGIWEDTTTATVLDKLEQNAGRKVWWLNFHD